MLSRSIPLLIIAKSGRMLAQAARNSGFIPLVIDCYGDQDTQHLAAEFIQVASLTIDDLRQGISFFKQRYKVRYLIYGSGFEAHHDSLVFLAQQFEVLGNSPETLNALQNSRSFFQHLTDAKIAYPEVRFNLPQDCNNWLFKPQHSYGGKGIRRLTTTAVFQPPVNDGYYQHYLAGESLSALFLANGKQAQVIGFNRQWSIALAQQPFVFAGIINQAELLPEHQATLMNWLNHLVAIYSLRGLNSLDFILHENVCYALEINARPPASMQLYQADLLTAHIEACHRHIDLPGFKNLASLTTYKAYQIIYAPKPVFITDTIKWLDCCVDIPAAHAIIDTGQPICSMIAAAGEPQQVFADLHHNQQLLFQYLHYRQ